jgi:membrane-associated phospholipid phosphatase
MNRTLLVVALVAALAAAGLAIYVAGHPFIPEDAVIERDVQSTDWGPLAITFPFFSWIGDAKGLVVEILIFLAILIFNRRAWLFAAGAVLTGGWYEVVSHLIVRPRPTTHDVLRVTEHPGASSFPSGHTIFIVTVTVVLMLCLGYRFLPRWARVIGWVLVVLTVATTAIARMYTGTHWPTDVLEGILIAVAWLTFLISLRIVADGVLGRVRNQEARGSPAADLSSAG